MPDHRSPDPDLPPAPDRESDDVLVRAIVTALDGRWLHHHDHNFAGARQYLLTGPARESVRLLLTPTRVLVETVAPSHLTCGPQPWLRLRISAARSKSPARLAGEIERRLLARYRPLLAAAEAAQRAHEHAEARLDALLCEVAELLTPLGEVRRFGTLNNGLIAGRLDDPVQVELGCSDGGSPVRVVLRLRPNLVRAIMENVVATARDAYLDTTHGPTDDTTELVTELAPVAVTALTTGAATTGCLSTDSPAVRGERGARA